MVYRCKNCDEFEKEFYVKFILDLSGPTWMEACCKIGEYPPFGQPTPKELSKLLGSQREYFFKGKQCENQGLGIGAFSYYRRMVEDLWSDILDKIIKVSKTVRHPQAEIAKREEEKNNNQFKQAYDNSKSLSKVFALNKN